jgi:hypothetical protein
MFGIHGSAKVVLATSASPAPIGCHCVAQRRAAYDARRTKRLGFGMTGGTAPSGERIPDLTTDEGKSHID